MASGSQGKIPGPYVHDTKEDNGLMEYVPFETTDIGSRRSGLPPSASTGPKRLQHVDGTDGAKGDGKHKRGGF